MPPGKKRQAVAAVQPQAQQFTPSGQDEHSGVMVSIHPSWPDIPCTQGELFFECTLFLYSVLALFLQYLNLYKTLWWLPKSYWHYSMKFHLINPYFLSCVGLLLGWRVTRCFWKTITENVAVFASNKSTFMQSCLTIFEYAIIKTPLMTLIITSFLFSFSRVCMDFPLKSVGYFFYPLCFYCTIFYGEIIGRWRRFREACSDCYAGKMEFVQLFEILIEPPPAQLDLDSVLHMCSKRPAQIRDEVTVLIEDLYLRLKRSLFAGLSTAFLSILLPCVFVPYKTNSGLPQKVLIDELWELQLGFIVACTSCSLYVTYLLPLNYLDLLHRCALHLGTWEPVDGPRLGQTGPANWAPSLWVPYNLYEDGEVIQLPEPSGRCFRARASPLNPDRTVAADPSCVEHTKFFMMCSRPCTLVNWMCIFEGCLIFVQFWMLILTSDWQHIVTLVLLMFANYLLLAKLFKDKIILGRIYDPSPEDLALIQQLHEERLLANMSAHR